MDIRKYNNIQYFKIAVILYELVHATMPFSLSN